MDAGQALPRAHRTPRPVFLPNTCLPAESPDRRIPERILAAISGCQSFAHPSRPACFVSQIPGAPTAIPSAPH